MMPLEVGKLYSCSEYFLLLFPDKETAATASITSAPVVAAVHVAATCAYWTRKLGKPVSFCDPETPLLVLSIKEEYIEVLAGNQKGWIIYRDWLDIGEIIDAAA